MRAVATPDVPNIWHYVAPMLSPAINMGGEHTLQSVYHAIMHGGMVLWINDYAAAVTSWSDFPAGRIAYVNFTGGKNPAAWIDKAEEAFSKWAKDMGCKELRLSGRRGWAKYLPHARQQAIYSRTV